MALSLIRNFAIVAHIDHGKSTLADRFLELTGTVEKRKMREQVLDQMELERERGITIKMQPVRMRWKKDGTEYILNLIDTPGHIDFSYEVSRALAAVEGVVLLVDATEGVQAQTLSVLEIARQGGLSIVPVVSKIDSPLGRVAEVRQEIAALLSCPEEDILGCSGKTGEGVTELLDAIVERIPAPRAQSLSPESLRALVFDFTYSDHRGVVVYVRLVDGTLAAGDRLEFAAASESFGASSVGIFSPEEIPVPRLFAGEIGYIVTGVKKPGVASVGDTIRRAKSTVLPLPGYLTPQPVVWASLFPESQDDFLPLRQALLRLRLSDAALSFEEESSGVLGRGFRCGFLGMLHLEITTERLRRESGLSLIVTSPSIHYDVEVQGGKRMAVYSPSRFPEHGIIEKVYEPWVTVNIIVPAEYIGSVVPLLFEYEAQGNETETFGEGRVTIRANLPLRELMRGFFDKLKSISSGFASFSYELKDAKEADVVRLDMLVADELVPAFSRIVGRRRLEEEAESVVLRLTQILPRQQFATKIQAQALGRILSSRTLPALRKNVTGHLYGGDITRKRKLWEKQKKGKKRLQERGKVTIPADVFLKMVRGN